MNIIRYEVKYVDDAGIRHLTFVDSWAAVRFYQDRFLLVEYTPL